jgi:hypothetical protein
MKKAKDTDRAALTDEGLSEALRVAALDRLLADGDLDILDALLPWLRGSPFLKANALRGLLGWLRLREYLDIAISVLRGEDAPEPAEDDIDAAIGKAYAQEVAAGALGEFGRKSVGDQDRIGRVLADEMVGTSDPGVRRACYDALLTMMGDYLPRVPSSLSLEHDVDWSRIREYLPASYKRPGRS